MAKILVVDDERVLVKGIKFNLENEGYEVSTGSDGEEAVELARTGDFDLIILDLMMGAVGRIMLEGMAGRIVFFLCGLVLCSFGVALLFHTYIAPEAYELMVKEISAKTGEDITKVKTIYDICSCALAVILSFLFFGFGHFEGVKAGTIFCALINGWTIGKCSSLLESLFDFRDAWDLKRYFA